MPMIIFPGQPTDIREVRAASWRECVPLNYYYYYSPHGLNTPQLWLIPSRNKDHQLWIIQSQDALFQPPIHMLSSDGNWSTLPEWRSWTKNMISIMFPHIVITHKSLQRVCHTFSQKLLSISNTDQFPVSSLTVQIWSVTSDICQVSL